MGYQFGCHHVSNPQGVPKGRGSIPSRLVSVAVFMAAFDLIPFPL